VVKWLGDYVAGHVVADLKSCDTRRAAVKKMVSRQAAKPPKEKWPRNERNINE